MSDDFFGLNMRDFVIGMQAGISGVFVLRKSKLRDIVCHVVVGGFTANYLHQPVRVVLEFIFGAVSHETAVYAAGLVGVGFSLGLIISASSLMRKVAR